MGVRAASYQQSLPLLTVILLLGNGTRGYSLVLGVFLHLELGYGLLAPAHTRLVVGEGLGTSDLIRALGRLGRLIAPLSVAFERNSALLNAWPGLVLLKVDAAALSHLVALSQVAFRASLVQETRHSFGYLTLGYVSQVTVLHDLMELL